MTDSDEWSSHPFRSRVGARLPVGPAGPEAGRTIVVVLVPVAVVVVPVPAGAARGRRPQRGRLAARFGLGFPHRLGRERTGRGLVRGGRPGRIRLRLRGPDRRGRLDRVTASVGWAGERCQRSRSMNTTPPTSAANRIASQTSITPKPSYPPRMDDAELLARLRMGDEDAFMTLVDQYGPLMLRIALGTSAPAPSRRRSCRRRGSASSGPGPLRGPLVPEDLDPPHRRQPRAHAWGTGGPERAALLARAEARGRAARSTPTASSAADHPRTPAAGRSRRTAGRACPRRSCSPPRPCRGARRDREAPAAPARGDRAARRRGLGARRRSPQALELTPGNQRVLLHRARCKVRADLEHYFDEVEA